PAFSLVQTGRSLGPPRSVFFFQAEGGIRSFHVTGVQTCALPIWRQLPVPFRRPLRGRRLRRPPELQEPLPVALRRVPALQAPPLDRKSTRLNSSHVKISYAVFCLKKKI